jgi:hypothetical protein
MKLLLHRFIEQQMAAIQTGAHQARTGVVYQGIATLGLSNVRPIAKGYFDLHDRKELLDGFLNNRLSMTAPSGSRLP